MQRKTFLTTKRDSAVLEGMSLDLWVQPHSPSMALVKRDSGPPGAGSAGNTEVQKPGTAKNPGAGRSEHTPGLTTGERPHLPKTAFLLNLALPLNLGSCSFNILETTGDWNIPPLARERLIN